MSQLFLVETTNKTNDDEAENLMLLLEPLKYSLLIGCNDTDDSLHSNIMMMLRS